VIRKNILTIEEPDVVYVGAENVIVNLEEGEETRQDGFHRQ